MTNATRVLCEELMAVQNMLIEMIRTARDSVPVPHPGLSTIGWDARREQYNIKQRELQSRRDRVQEVTNEY